jgi:hypothetical protein
LVLLFKKASVELRCFSVAVLLSVIIFKGKSLVFVVPIIALGYSYLFDQYKSQIKDHFFTKVVLAGIFLVIAVSFITFFDLLWNHSPRWFNENDLRQYQMWSELTAYDISQNTLMVTDRFGEPAYYYLYYKIVDPTKFQTTKSLGPIIASGIQRIDKIGNVKFGSFKYFESDRKENQIWVGVSGEFVGENRPYQGLVKVVDGEIYQKITGVKQENQFLGDEVWFVRTVFKQNE